MQNQVENSSSSHTDSRSAASGTASSNVDDREVARFAALSAEWWDPNGKCRPLHQITPARMGFIRAEACRHFGREDKGLRPLSGLTTIDVGAGGGLASEPLCRMGASVTAIDPAVENMEAARQHAELEGLAIDYRAVRAEDVVAEGRRYDLVVSLEVIEHVPQPAAFVAACAQLLAPGGLLVLSTINRTLKSYALAIVGAEYVLRWLPVGTHQWDRFVTPEELKRYLGQSKLHTMACQGLVYDPLGDRWQTGSDTGVNYLIAAAASA